MLSQSLDMISLKLKLFFLSSLSLSLLFLPFASANGASLTDEINKQNQVFAGEKGANLSDSDPRLVVAQVIKVVISILGTLLTCWTVYGGFLILTSAGDEEKIATGKSVVTNGVIGLIIILSAYSIASFVLKLWNQPATQLPQGPQPVVDQSLYDNQ